MAQNMPVVRQVHWIQLLPQVAVLALLAVIIDACAPRLRWNEAILIAAAAYLVWCRILRAIVTRNHIAGMKAYRARRFNEAISHYLASYRFFSAHPHLDAWRSAVFGVASGNPYRIIALCNMAYCHGQIGEGQKAIELFEQALAEQPDCTLARVSLNMLRSTAPAPTG